MWSSSLCALSGGRLSSEEIAGLAERLLASELAVRLTPDAEAGRRRPPEWSTVAHRALEDRTVALVEALAGRPGPAVDPAAVEATLADAGGLGDDQADSGPDVDRGGRQSAGRAGPGRVRQDDHAARRRPGRGRPRAGR